MKKTNSSDYVIYFQILEVTSLSTKDEIKKSYLRLIKQWHPDRFPNDNIKAHEATEKCKLLNEAYEKLKDYKPPEIKSDTGFKQKYSSTKKPDHKRHSINRVKVKSSNINSIGYDTILKFLQVEFRDGSIYEYFEVPEMLFNELMKAESKGKFANQFIFSKYRYSRV